jgi:hypothetical protein
MPKPHWSVRAWPNLGLSVCAWALPVLFWLSEYKALEAMEIGGAVGVLDGLLTFLGRRQILPRVHTAITSRDALFVHMQSPWTRGRNTIAMLLMVVLGFVFLPRLPEPTLFSVVKLIAGYCVVSFFLRALVLARAGQYAQPPSNPSLERP